MNNEKEKDISKKVFCLTFYGRVLLGIGKEKKICERAAHLFLYGSELLGHTVKNLRDSWILF